MCVIRKQSVASVTVLLRELKNYYKYFCAKCKYL